MQTPYIAFFRGTSDFQFNQIFKGISNAKKKRGNAHSKVLEVEPWTLKAMNMHIFSILMYI